MVAARRGHRVAVTIGGLAALVAVGSCVLDERPTIEHARCDGTECACEASYADCDGSAANGCETDTRLDPQHCGRCGRDCRDGACGNGRCTPYLVTEPFGNIESLVAHAGHVYFCESHFGNLMRISQSGGVPELLAWDQSCLPGMAVSGERLYWFVGDHSNMVSVLQSGTLEDLAARRPPEAHWSSPASIVALNADADWVVWGLRGEERDAVMALSTSTGEIREVFGVPSISEVVTAVAVGDGGIVWATKGSDPVVSRSQLYWASSPSAAPEQLYQKERLSIRELQVDQGVLHWLEQADTGDSANANAMNRVMRQALAHGAAEVVATSSRPFVELRVDALVMYWAESLLSDDPETALGHWIYRLEPGGITEILAETLEVDHLSPGDEALFWYDEPGKLMALSK